MKRTLALLAVLTAAAFAAHAAFAHTSRIDGRTGVVIIETNLAYRSGAAAGTGIVLTSSGEVLTNNHVIRGATTIAVAVPHTHTSYTAKVLGYSVRSDVALLQLQHASGLATAPIGDSSKLATGQSVTAVGNAGGTGSLTVTTGSITGLHRTITVSDEAGTTVQQLADLIEMDAALQPGDSGGALLDDSGKVIGMNAAASVGFRFRGSNDGYAIPIARAVALAKQIAAGRSSAQVHVGGTPFLGVQVQDSPLANGEVVTAVVPSSPAAKSGLSTGDTIVSVAGHPVRSQSAVISLLVMRHPGDRLTIRWVDGLGRLHTATLRLASGPPQ